MIACGVRKLTIVASALLLCVPVLLAQSGAAVDNIPGVATETTNQTLAPFEEQNPYLGGVPTGTVVPGVLPVSLDEAVQRGLKQNLGLLLSSDTLVAAQGRRWQILSALLPNAVTETSLNAHQLDVKTTIGIHLPDVPPVIGPFSVFDTRAYVNQTVFDWQSIERARSSDEQVKAALYSYRNARDLVVLAVASSYLLAIADEARVTSALAERDTAKALYQQTLDQKRAGVAAAVDVLRSEVELQARQQELIVARNNLAKQKLVLARVIGLPAGQAFDLTTEVAYQPLATMSLDEALQGAYVHRPDYQSAIAQLQSAGLQRKAAAAERYPSISVEADYGDIGVTPATSHGTVDAAAVLKVPIFEGGKIHGDVLEANAALKQARERLANLRAQIDQDVRDAFLDLEASGAQVSVEQNAITLASETLQQSRDRFASGVTDNIEVVQAQESLAAANDSYIASLYSYNVAKISLARAMGVAESNYALYLKGQ
ncbi:MAG: TolC family protein [Candidatus Acidiferrales bacterium]